MLNSENDQTVVAHLNDDSKTLGFYGVRDWQVIKARLDRWGNVTSYLTSPQVDDTNPATSFTGQLSDVSQVEKFELTDGEYSERQGGIIQSPAVDTQTDN